MTLDNLIGKLLERINPDSSAIQRLLEAAQRNIKDSELAELSNENRFDAAYKAIMQLSNGRCRPLDFEPSPANLAITRPCYSR